MSRSYRKPYAAVTSHSNSQDKVDARRSVRRREDQALRDFKNTDRDWEEFMIPERYECASNDVWGWSRDGRQSLCGWNHQYFNLYWLVDKWTRVYQTEAQILQHCLDRIESHAEWLIEITRK